MENGFPFALRAALLPKRKIIFSVQKIGDDYATVAVGHEVQIPSPQPKTKNQSIWTAFSFLERCVPLSRNVMRTSCVMTASPCDVPFGRVKEHITSLCAVGATHHCAIALHHLPTRANITLYKRPKLCYNYLIKTKGGISLWVYSVQLKLYFNSEKS